MLLEVNAGWVLQMPHGVGNPHERVWLMPGGVVNGGDPYVAHLIKGQEHKFKQARPGAIASELPAVLNAGRAEWETKTPAKPQSAIKQAEAIKTAAATGSTSGIEVPSIGGKKR
jgi:hypothetical protein